MAIDALLHLGGRPTWQNPELPSLTNRGNRLLLIELSPLAPELPGTEGDRGNLQIGHPKWNALLGGCRQDSCSRVPRPWTTKVP